MLPDTRYIVECLCDWWTFTDNPRELEHEIRLHRKTCRRKITRTVMHRESAPSDRPVYHAHTTDKGDQART